MTKDELLEQLKHVDGMTDIYVMISVNKAQDSNQLDTDYLQGYIKVHVTRVITEPFRATLLTETIDV